jgi:hypothetical protein
VNHKQTLRRATAEQMLADPRVLEFRIQDIHVIKLDDETAVLDGGIETTYATAVRAVTL